MIQTQTLLKVSDNSGGKSVRCLKLLKKGNNPRSASVGDTLVVSVQSIRFKNSKRYIGLLDGLILGYVSLVYS